MKKMQKIICWLAAATTVAVSVVQADIVVQPTAVTAVDNAGDQDVINGSGINNPELLETGDAVPTTWPAITTANSDVGIWRGGWVGDTSQTGTGNYVWLTLGNAYDVKGLYWWGSTRTNARGTEKASFAISTDGGDSYTEILTDYDVIDSTNSTAISGEYIDFGSTITGVTHVRVDNTQYSGYEGTINEIRIVADPPPPAPPFWSEPVTGVIGIEGMDYNDSLAGKAIDVNGDQITYAVTAGNGWLNVETNGVLSGIPDVLGTNTFTVTADDGNGNGSPVEATLTIFVRESLPPEWTEPVTSGNGRVDTPYSGTLEGKATDPDGGTITYSLTDAGTWLNVETNGVLTGTPTSGDEGSNTFTVVADDGFDTPTSTTLTIFVKEELLVGRNISINFAQNTNQPLLTGDRIGPLETTSTNWNNSLDRDNGSLGTGDKADLVDYTGATTTADIAWTAFGVDWNRRDTAAANEEERLSVGYLNDDDTTPVTATLTEIPYAQYRVYVLLSSTQANNDPAGYDASNGLVTDGSNGGVWAFGGNDQTTRKCFSSVRITKTVTGSTWSEATDAVIGNYWVMDDLSGSTLSIVIGGNTTPGRASIAGLIIEETGAAAPVSDLVIAGPFAGGMELSWTSENGKPYGVQTNDNLIIMEGWATWLTGITGDGGTLTVTNTIGPDQTFYRVISE